MLGYTIRLGPIAVSIVIGRVASLRAQAECETQEA